MSREIPHAAGQLSPQATATEACAPRVRVLQQEKPLQRDTWALQLESSPSSQQL